MHDQWTCVCAPWKRIDSCLSAPQKCPYSDWPRPLGRSTAQPKVCSRQAAQVSASLPMRRSSLQLSSHAMTDSGSKQLKHPHQTLDFTQVTVSAWHARGFYGTNLRQLTHAYARTHLHATRACTHVHIHTALHARTHATHALARTHTHAHMHAHVQQKERGEGAHLFWQSQQQAALFWATAHAGTLSSPSPLGCQWSLSVHGVDTRLA